MQFSHQQGQGYQQPQFKQQSFNYNQSTTTSTTLDGSSSSSSSSTTTSSSTQTTSSTSGNLYTPANVLGMYMTELVVKSVVLGEMLITGRVRSHGYTVNNTPEKGSILQTSEGSYGHVAYVESVGSNGSVTVSEMNYSGGPYVKDTRTISSQASSYNYIHLS